MIALDAATGAPLWTYNAGLGNAPWWSVGINRGVALGDGRVYLLTADDRLVALNATTSALDFSTQLTSPALGYSETSAPLVAGSVVVVGSAGGDQGVRGFVAGYSATTGVRLWKLFTVPAPGSEWNPATGSHGGGAVWTTPVWNPATGTLYAGTGNPSPNYFGGNRPGPDPYTDSVIAVHVSSGHLLWAAQEVPHDLWDYDVASPPVLFSRLGRLAVGEAGKDGLWYEWNATTGAPLTPPIAFVRIDHSPPTPSGVEEWPGSEGGANYGHSAYDPVTRDTYIAGINGPQILYSGVHSHAPMSAATTRARRHPVRPSMKVTIVPRTYAARHSRVAAGSARLGARRRRAGTGGGGFSGSGRGFTMRSRSARAHARGRALGDR